MLMSNYWDITHGKEHLDNAFSDASDDISSKAWGDITSATIEALAQEKPVQKVKEPAMLELLNKHKHSVYIPRPSHVKTEKIVLTKPDEEK